MKDEDTKLKAIQELHKKDKIASLAGDIETLLSLFTDDGIIIPDQGDIIQGKTNLKHFLEENNKILETHDLVEYNHDFQEIQIMGEYAYEWGYYSGKYIVKESGEEITGGGKLMRILALQKDRSWKVTRSIWTVDRE